MPAEYNNCRYCGRTFMVTYDNTMFCGWPCKLKYEQEHHGGGCFITTAVCKTLNKPDDCAELTSLRNFRDAYMNETPEMHEEIHEYYHIAPQICAEIEKAEDSGNRVYTEIWERYLKSAVEAVDKGEKQKAHDIYKQMVLDLKRDYLRRSRP